MTQLRLRIAAILIGAIVLVLAVGTLASIVAITYPLPARMVGPMAFQIRALNGVINPGRSSFLSMTQSEIDQLGPVRADLSQAIRDQLSKDGIALPVTVYDNPQTDTPVAVVTIGSERVDIDFPKDLRPPMDFLVIMGAWMGLVVVCVVVVSLVMAYRVTRPFAVLERAVGTVGPDGVLPHVPEVGSRETIETAMMLNRLSDRLRAAMESRMRLVAAAGHDFRTPMTRMRLRAEFLDDEERASWLKDIDELERIADSAIGLVREEVSQAQLEMVWLDEMLAGEVHDLIKHGYALQLGKLDHAALPLPPLAMRRALRNLLINAATHGKSATAELHTRAGNATITIRDEGPGIPDDLLARVFEPFFRAEPGRLQTVPGAGLGLALAAEIVERSGGTLTIRNRQSRGLEQTIAFALPSIE
ncbi:sensor histidine kinase [uncultured Devosia sp.]|uniref:sensor histidine kinase n=1 Tax=uncultured Devosia sp. TaxID=211434 RepID=UPI0035CC1167